MTAADALKSPAGRAPRSIGLVLAASCAGTVFEWYDFFIFGSLAAFDDLSTQKSISENRCCSLNADERCHQEERETVAEAHAGSPQYICMCMVFFAEATAPLTGSATVVFAPLCVTAKANACDAVPAASCGCQTVPR